MTGNVFPFPSSKERQWNQWKVYLQDILVRSDIEMACQEAVLLKLQAFYDLASGLDCPPLSVPIHPDEVDTFPSKAKAWSDACADIWTRYLQQLLLDRLVLEVEFWRASISR